MSRFCVFSYHSLFFLCLIYFYPISLSVLLFLLLFFYFPSRHLFNSFCIIIFFNFTTSSSAAPICRQQYLANLFVLSKFAYITLFFVQCMHTAHCMLFSCVYICACMCMRVCINRRLIAGSAAAATTSTLSLSAAGLAVVATASVCVCVYLYMC